MLPLFRATHVVVAAVAIGAGSVLYTFAASKYVDMGPLRDVIGRKLQPSVEAPASASTQEGAPQNVEQT